MNVTHVVSIELKNFKNVLSGKIEMPKNGGYDKNNVLGIYGQNASGKTTMIKAISLVQSILGIEPLPKSPLEVVNIESGSDASIEINLISVLNKKIYDVSCKFSIGLQDDELFLVEEVIKYKRNLKKELDYGFEPDIKRAPTYELISKFDDELPLKYVSSMGKDQNAFYNELEELENFRLKIRKEDAQKEHTSFLFLEDVIEIMPDEAQTIIRELGFKLLTQTLIFDAQDMAQVYRNLFLPLSFHLEFKTSGISGRMGIHTGNIENEDSPFMILDKIEYHLADHLFNQINELMPTFIPGLKIELENQGQQAQKNGEIGIRTGLLSVRNTKKIPFSYESEGVKKLASMISLFVAMYSNPNVLVVIDELDAGIYEYLLGEILKVLNQGGSGQLLFTSHNLRLLEVLKSENFVFSTADENNRYVKITDIKRTNNLRNSYLRNIIFGGENEKFYEETDTFDMRKAFERAGSVKL